MFHYFPDQHTWSAQFVMGLWAGGQFGEMHRWLDGLREGERSEAAWEKAWNGMAKQQEDIASADVKAGYRRSAGSRYLRAAVYRFCGERQIPPDRQRPQAMPRPWMLSPRRKITCRFP